MITYLDVMPISELNFRYLVFIRHITTSEISIVGVDDDNELDYLGCDNLASLSEHCGWIFTDSEGEEHEITILIKTK